MPRVWREVLLFVMNKQFPTGKTWAKQIKPATVSECVHVNVCVYMLLNAHDLMCNVIKLSQRPSYSGSILSAEMSWRLNLSAAPSQ